MALKGPRSILETDITCTLDVVSARGFIAVYNTTGSGVALGDSASICTIITSASGYKPAGLLMNDVVNVDTTKYHINFQKDETLVNERVTLLKKGRITTDALTSGRAPSAGDKAYLGASGKFTDLWVNDVATPFVGKFASKKDQNAYISVDVNI